VLLGGQACQAAGHVQVGQPNLFTHVDRPAGVWIILEQVAAGARQALIARTGLGNRPERTLDA
jgi:hypothetical protein